MPDLIDDLFRQNEWANLRLLEACRALSDEQLDATAVGGYGSIRDTLMHFVGAEGRYVRRLGGVPASEAQGPGWAGFDALEEAVRASAAGLIERARAVTGQTLELTDIDDDHPERPFDVDAAVVLVQALNHSTEHRGQVCTVLTALGVTPPEIDGWTWGRETGRTRARGA